ncbi:SPOR domain-containing protein [Piscirickettsia salmonis]|uniref:SPOR domain-containing protein n=1 Tax=Piscirickettsia salmonis TaxID=1238 RepID=UPI001E61870C|nr:SPOR domain-containing protein [Piscirickettsia salmonis]QGP60969.1 cell division protein FtsN [Piscirickettsia salmonis]
MIKDRRKKRQSYLDERRREQDERKRHLDQVVRQKEKRREVLQKERLARRQAEFGQYAKKRRALFAQRENKRATDWRFSSSGVSADSLLAEQKVQRAKKPINAAYSQALPEGQREHQRKLNLSLKLKLNLRRKQSPAQPKRLSAQAFAHSRSEHAHGLPTFGWLLCGILALCLFGGLGYFYFLRPMLLSGSDGQTQLAGVPAQSQRVSVELNQSGASNNNAEIKANSVFNKQVAGQKTVRHVKSVSQAPKFEFYTILPKQEVWSPAKRQDVTAAEKTKGLTTSPSQKKAQENQYVLQIASFRTYKDAQELQQRLENLQLHPYLSIVKLQSGQQWHRVMLGPFTSKREAEKVRRQLQDASIQPGLLKRQ